MSTPAQKEFLIGHIHHLMEQTQRAEDDATDILQQVTARRLRRMLIAAHIYVEELPEDGSTTTAWRTAVGVSLLEALGFEEPT